MKRHFLFLSITALIMLLAACESSGPQQVVEDYLRAWVDGDGDRLASLACAAWEDQARIQANSFSAASATLEGMSCQPDGESDGYALVTCMGDIALDYGAEQRTWQLETYRAIQEGGDWRFCGEGDPPE